MPLLLLLLDCPPLPPPSLRLPGQRAALFPVGKSLRSVRLPLKSSLKPFNAAKVPPLLLPSAPKAVESLSEVTPYLQSQLRHIIFGWLCSVASVISLSQIIPRVGSLTSASSSFSDQTGLAKLRDEGLVLGVLFLSKLLATYLQESFLWEASLNAVYRIRLFIFERVLQRDLGFLEGRNGVSPGDVAHRITDEASDVADTLYALLNSFVPCILQISAMTTQMLIASPVLSLVSAMVIPCVAFFMAYLGERLRKTSNKSQLSIASLSAYLNEVLPAVLFVKANNAEACESARFQRLAHAERLGRLKKKKMKSLIPQIIPVTYLGSLLVFCAGSLLVSGNNFSASRVLSFLTSLVFLIEPIQGLGKAYNELKQGEPAIQRLFDLTRFKCTVTDKPDAIDLDNVIGEVKFCDISFRYGENMPHVLNRLNLHVKSGETVALVGPSGGGKSTLVKLLLRLYEPFSGSILIDNHDIRDIRLESLRKHIGLVSQDVTLFSGTVAENIGYRDIMTTIDMTKVELAAQSANADEFIETLPQGYNTNVGPRGSSLSGGQKQRLAIARALYQNSSILILDEATSALDSRSEQLVRQALERLMENRTVIVIAHRMETVLMATRVLLLESGKLEEVSRSKLLGNPQDSKINQLVI